MMERGNKNDNAIRLVNPVEVFKEEYPEAFDLLPGGEEDLAPEVGAMVALSRKNGLPVSADNDTGEVLVPKVVCEYVFGKPLKRADIRSYLNYTREGIAPNGYHLEAAA